MASTVYSTEEVTLQDDTEVLLKPLNIKSLRVFMETMDAFGKVQDEEQGLNVLLDASSICLRSQRPELWDNSLNDKKGGHTEDAEELLDMPTIYKILEICGGVKLNDPNLIAAATELALGQTSTSQDS